MPRTFEAVQILRGLAASLVVFHHFCYVIAEYHPQTSLLASWRGLAAVGAAGVDIFFCISGFVIVHAARKLPSGRSSAMEFMQRRLSRVLPLYWLFTAILFVAWASGHAFTSLVMTPQLMIASLLLIPYPKHTVDGDVSLHPLLDVGWTLTFELYFYLVCSAVVLFGGGRRIFPWVVPALAALAGLSLMVSGPALIVSSVLASPLLVEFAAGAALAWMAEPLLALNRRLGGRLGRLLLAGGTLGLAASALHDGAADLRVIYWGIPGLLLTAGAMMASVGQSSRAIAGFVFLGAASYTIYLAHPLATLTTGTLLKGGWLQEMNPDLLILSFTLATVLAAAASYPALERPLLKLRDRRQRRNITPVEPLAPCYEPVTR